MKKESSILLLWLSVSVYLYGCANPDAVPVSSLQFDGFDIRFFVADSSGPTTRFAYREDILFVFLLRNLGPVPRTITFSHLGPLVNFEVYSGNRLIGSTGDGLSFPTTIARKTLLPGDTLRLEASWLGLVSHPSPLPPGQYVARVVPYFWINSPAEQWNLPDISFVVVEPER